MGGLWCVLSDSQVHREGAHSGENRDLTRDLNENQLIFI